MEMRAGPGENGVVEFRVCSLATERRAPQPLLDETRPDSGASLLRMCGWCKKIWTGARWVEIEAAATDVGLLETGVLPRVSHDICDDCEKKVMKAIEVP